MTLHTLLFAAAMSAMAADSPAAAPAETAAEPSAISAPLTPLEAAYQKEFAYLLAEKESLEARIAAQAAQADSLLQASRERLAAAQARLAATEVRVDAATDALAASERDAEAAANAADQLDAAWSQATSSLGDRLDSSQRPESWSDPAATAKAFDAAIQAGLARVHADARLSEEDGRWFDAQGVEQTGRVVRVGQVAAFARTKPAMALAPVGGDRFRVVDTSNADAWLAGGKAATVRTYLFEGTARAAELPRDTSIADTIEDGGLIGQIILALGALALVLVGLRTQWLARQAGTAPDAAARAVADKIHRYGLTTHDATEQTVLEAIAVLDRFGTAILVIAAVAPLLGLLGTVTGMIATFDIITTFGTGDPRMLSGGISAALVTTQFGLIVAIPALLAGNLLAGWADRISQRIETAALAAGLGATASLAATDTEAA